MDQYDEEESTELEEEEHGFQTGPVLAHEPVLAAPQFTSKESRRRHNELIGSSIISSPQPHPHDKTVIPLIHDLMFHLVSHPIDSSPGSRHPLVLFFVLANLTENSIFRPVGGMVFSLHAFKYGAKICVYRQITLNHRQGGDLPPKSLLEEGRLLLPLLFPGSPGTAMTWVQTAHSIIIHTSKLSPPRPRFLPCDDTGALFEYKGRKQHLRDIVTMEQAMLATLENDVCDFCTTLGIVKGDLPSPDELASIRDDANNATPNYSIFTDPALPLHKFSKLAINKLVHNPSYVEISNTGTHYPAEIWSDTSNAIKRIAELLFACSYLMRGPVGTGEVICRETYVNTPDAYRNWCYDHREKMGLLYASSTAVLNNLSSSTTVIRAQCPRLSYITLLYLLIIRPLDIWITITLKLSKLTENDVNLLGQTYVHFACDKVFTPTVLTKVIRTWTGAYLGVSYSTSDVRQIWGYVTRRCIRTSDRLGHLLAYLDLQAGHSVKEATRSYGRTNDRSQTVPTDGFISISKAFHELFGVSEGDTIDLSGES